ncbi:MAG TPA: hypothetical protein QF468_12035 [Nitrospinota bacterium]|jgi:hypothetical protein|nr:hypothetical protein [Nitrospinota bacterium]
MPTTVLLPEKLNIKYLLQGKMESRPEVGIIFKKMHTYLENQNIYQTLLTGYKVGKVIFTWN